VRLLSLGIHPIFVFDGPNKPIFKRNRRSGTGNGVSTAMAKRLIRLFGFTAHDAPGEAEAECAYLEQQGIVDAVLSEDVDTIMFGSRVTLRDWSSEGSKGGPPTHVTLHDAKKIAEGPSGLDREGMVLVALMSGGDYLPDGIPGCGIKVACQAAKAGFGKELCRIKRADKEAITEWKQRLLHELRTNESGFFRTKHKALEIPENFPNMEVLRYYTHPVVSSPATIERLRQEFPPSSTVDIAGLREFTRETFDWTFRPGAIKLIKVLAPGLLVQRCLDRYVSGPRIDDPDLKKKEESTLVKGISMRREHFSTDATPELRVSFIPAELVGLDPGQEPEVQVEAFGRSGLALNSDDEFDEDISSSQKAPKKPFDPWQPDLAWVPETILKLGVPVTVEDWEEGQRSKGRAKEDKTAAKAKRKTKIIQSNMPAGALDKYVTVTKNISDTTVKSKESAPITIPSSPPKPSSQPAPPTLTRSKQAKKPSTKLSKQPTTRPSLDINPWTIASSQCSPPRAGPSSTLTADLLSTPTNDPPRSPAVSHVAKTMPGGSTTSSDILPSHTAAAARDVEPILIESSPVVPPPGTTASSTMANSSHPRQGTLVRGGVRGYGQKTPPKRQKRRVGQRALEEAEDSPALPTDEAKPSEVHAESQLVRKDRTFKRVKSGTEDDLSSNTASTTTQAVKQTTAPSSTSTQTSIKSFGRVSKEPIKISSEKVAAIETIVLSDSDSDSDDDDDLPLLFPTKKAPPFLRSEQNPSSSSTGSRSASSSTFVPASKSSTLVPDDDNHDEADPFGPILPPSGDNGTQPIRSASEIPQGMMNKPTIKLITPIRATSEPAIGHSSSPDLPPSNDTKSNTTTVIMPSTNPTTGFFVGMEMSREEAMRLTRDFPEPGDDDTKAEKKVLGRGVWGWNAREWGKERRMWRVSEIEVVDLTGED